MYIPLHVHTEYSILDGMSSVSELCERAKELGLPGIAITDHGMMMGVKPFYSYFKSQAPDIKPILGSEIYITDRYDYRLKDSEHRRTFHLILLAKNLSGYRNLCKIVSIAATEGMYNKPRVDLSVLRQYHDGLICMSACIGGEIPQYILDEDIEGAEAAILRYKEIFGEDFYLEVCIHPNNREGNPQEVVKWQMTAAEAIYALGKKFGIKVVATNDSHFTYKNQAEAHDVMLAMNCKKLVTDPTRLHYTGEEYLKSEREMLAVFPEHPEAVWNTMDIFHKVENYDIDSPVVVPLPKTFSPDTDCDKMLRDIANKGFEKLFPSNDAKARQRLDWELDVIAAHGFSRNFLMMEDIIRFARNEGIAYGPGRGSAAGCLVNYCLGITKINPLEYGLLFERFINPDICVSFPGIDIDLESGGISKAWRHLREVYGDDCIAGQVILETPVLKLTFGRVSKAMGISCRKVNSIMRAFEESGRDTRVMDNYFSQLRDDKEELQKAYTIAKELSGRKSGLWTHACAIFIGERPLSDYLPVMKGESYFVGEEIQLVQYEKDYPVNTGIVKINLLELKQLNTIKDTLKEIHSSKTDIDISTIMDDADTNMMMYLGNKKGVFQFETEMMAQYLRQFKYCPKFADLMVMNTMYRPGLFEKIGDYQNFDPEKTEGSGIDELDRILLETHGLPIYQEQYIAFLEIFLHKSPGAAVEEYKAMAKKKADQLPAYKAEFKSVALKKNVKESDAENAWSILTDNASFAFLKSHAICYTTISYQCAFLKAHFPGVFRKFLKIRGLILPT